MHTFSAAGKIPQPNSKSARIPKGRRNAPLAAVRRNLSKDKNVVVTARREAQNKSLQIKPRR